VLQKPNVNAGPDKTLLSGNSGILDGSIGGADYSFIWSPDFFMSDPSSLRPSVNPISDTAYVLTATSLSGCGSHSDTVKIRVYKEVKIPNVFTPNGDGINDRWEIPALTAYRSYAVLIFNRYGQTVFESRNYITAWDGKYGGKALPIGTYYYIIDLKDTGAKISGWVEILK
jgi:gliding motility-associated-like protein